MPCGLRVKAATLCPRKMASCFAIGGSLIFLQPASTALAKERTDELSPLRLPVHGLRHRGLWRPIGFAQADPVSILRQAIDARNRGDLDGLMKFFAADAVR